jgi:programmed cell death 8 (apoptosis-inducing factor)
MNFLKATGHSVRFAQRRGLVKTARLYSTTTATKQSGNSSLPWAIGSFLVFGPVLFKLTSPPPPTKKHESLFPQHVKPIISEPVVEEPKHEEPKQEKPVAVKKVQKPYVLVGAGTASFAAAQAIKEKDPEANVSFY